MSYFKFYKTHPNIASLISCILGQKFIKQVTNIRDKQKRLDELAWTADLSFLKYYKPSKGYSIKQDHHSCEDGWLGIMEESESEDKTG
jgi:hypothetical protein